jgi:hypothetical protein
MSVDPCSSPPLLAREVRLDPDRAPCEIDPREASAR